MRSSIIIKIFISFLLVSLLPIGILTAYNDWANRKIVFKMKIEEIKNQAAEELWKFFKEEKDFLGKGSLCILTDTYCVRIAPATNSSLVFKSWVMLNPEVKNKLETEHHYGEDITEIGFTEIPEVSKALAKVEAYTLPTL